MATKRKNTKSRVYDAVYPREYIDRDGVKQSHMVRVGRAFAHEKGINLELWVTPPVTIDPETGIPLATRIVLFEETSR